MNSNHGFLLSDRALSHADLSTLCSEFDRRWSIGETPSIEEFLSHVDESNKPAALERLLTIELAYQRLSGHTLSEKEYRLRFPDHSHVLDQVFQLHDSSEQLYLNDSLLKSQSSTFLWKKVALAVDPEAAYQPEQMIDRYRLIEPVGRGGFGEVWRAIDTELEREVAIKLARSDKQFSDGLIGQLRTEARHAASLKHPGIVPVYDIGQTARGTYVVSEFIEGETLTKAMQRGALTCQQAVKVATQIAEALHHAHLRGLVHRDVKPGNILLRAAENDALLADFGLAVTEIDQLRETPSTVGTWWYMSPEQARGESHRVDARSDVYSLGVVLYQMLTARLPFLSSSRQEFLNQLMNRPPRPMRTINAAIDAELEKICLRCLEKDVANRFTTCADLAAALRDWGENHSVEKADVPRLRSSESATGRLRNLSSWLWMGFTVACIAMIVIVIDRSKTNHRPGNEKAENSQPVVAVAGNLPNQAMGVTPKTVTSDAVTPDAVTPDAVTSSDGWQELLAEPPKLFAHSMGFIKEKPFFDPSQKLYSVRADQMRWIATTGDLSADEFELQAEFSIKNWVGAGGFIWQLAVDSRNAPERAYRCFCVEYQRISAAAKPHLRWKEYVIREMGYDDRMIGPHSGFTSEEVSIPGKEWVTMKCRVSRRGLTVWFNDEDAWQASNEYAESVWLPSLNAPCGITGLGEEVKVRGLSVRIVR